MPSSTPVSFIQVSGGFLPRASTLRTAAVLSLTPFVLAAQAPADYGPVSANVAEIAYPYPVSTLPFVFLRKGRPDDVHGRQATGTPNGQTVVLLHGFNFFGEAWRGTIDVLTREGFRVIVPDQIGFGRSSKPLVPYTFNDMALNTRRLLRSLGIERAAIVGHSMGGMLASRFAMLFPTMTTHVVMVNQIGLTDARPGRVPRYLDDAYRADSNGALANRRMSRCDRASRATS
jgi:pimeloyl-ACP methyl ester carboxylesterase